MEILNTTTQVSTASLLRRLEVVTAEQERRYRDTIKAIGEMAFSGIPEKRRWISVHKKLEKVPLVEVYRWYDMGLKAKGPGGNGGKVFNVQFKIWRNTR
jgi:hypothetical protein